jgi:two-component system cell cycle sensor histidine kinase/response regulator CckA
MHSQSMRGAEPRAILLQLRGVLWLVIAGLLVFRPGPVSPGVWLIATGFLASSLLLAFLPSTWFRNPNISYVVFFLDMTGLTIILRSASPMGSTTLMLFYLTVFMATSGEDLRKSVGVAVVVAALYLWLDMTKSGKFTLDAEGLLHIPLFFTTAAACGYLAQEVRACELKLQEKAEADAIALERQYQPLFQSNPHPMWVHDLESLAFLDVNQAAADQYGYSRDEFLQMKADEILFPEALPELCGTVVRGEKVVPNSLEQRHRKKDGSVIDVEIHSHHIAFAGKQAELVLASDISARKRAEEILRTTNQALQTLIHSSPLAMIWLDTDGKVQSWNPAAEAIFGWSEVEVLGNPLLIVPEDLQSESRDMQARVFRGEVVTNQEVRRQRKDGSMVDISVSAAPLYDAQGRIYGMEGILADISRSKQLEEQFRHAQKMEAVGRLAAGVAHDFNNLLTIITGYSRLLEERVDADSQLRDYAQEVRKAGERAATLTRQLLVFSRKQISNPQILQLNMVLSNMEKMVRRLIGEDVELAIIRGAQLECVKGDPGRLEQVIMNLAVNARDAMPQGGRLTIRTANIKLDRSDHRGWTEIPPGAYVLLAVADTGCGMDAKTQSHIFEPFFTTKKAGKGTGLGLATVYGIVRQCGGYISVRSKPGRGATFEILLPALLHEKCSGCEESPGLAELPTGSETILLVEDDDAVRSMTTYLLEAQGYKVLAAAGPEEAIHTSQQLPEPVPLLLTDVVLPKMSGLQLAEHLTFLWPTMRTVFMSGYSDEALSRYGVKGSGMSFLQKPFTREALAVKVREVLDSAVATMNEAAATKVS